MTVIREYDENNNLIHYRDSNGYEEWCEYDANNNLIHYRNNDGIEENYDGIEENY